MSATRAFALRSTLRTACRPVQSQARISLGRRGYASAQGAVETAKHVTHKAGSDLPWLATSLAISLPTIGYLLYTGPEKKSHAEHVAEASDEHGVQQQKPDSEIGEASEPTPTSETDTGDAESKGHVVGAKPEGVDGGKEDSEEQATPQDNVKKEQAKDEGGESDKDASEGKKREKTDAKQSDEESADQKRKGANEGKGKTDSSGKDLEKGSNEMDDSTESQEKKLSEKPPAKKVDPTKK